MDTIRDAGNVADWRGVGDVVAMATERLSAPAEGMHRAIVGRWLGVAGPRVEAGRGVVDGMIASAYSSVRLGGSMVGSTISILADSASDHVEVPPVWETDTGRYVQSVLNGVWGDELHDRASPVSIELGLRDADGEPIPVSHRALRTAFPDASGRIAVLIHGLGETERCWRSADGGTLADGLRDDGFTVLSLRYNTGREIDANGRALAMLVEGVVAEWPVRIDDIVLVGHSMGGLVARSAVVAGADARHEWVATATHVVGVGTPHHGAFMEKAVEGIGGILRRFGETRPLASFLDARSAGIKDLRDGVSGRPDGVQCHVVAGTVTPDPSHHVGALVGDLVVGLRSATDRAHRCVEPPATVLVLGGRNHARLIHDAEAIAHVRHVVSGAGDRARRPSEHSPG